MTAIANQNIENLPSSTPSTSSTSQSAQVLTMDGLFKKFEIDSSDLSLGKALLNREYSAWGLASKKTKGQWFATVKTLFFYVTQGKNLVKQAKASQTILKNPEILTNAIKNFGLSLSDFDQKLIDTQTNSPEKNSAFETFKAAFNEVSKFVETNQPEKRFDIHKQLVAVVTQNLAEKMGIKSSDDVSALGAFMGGIWTKTSENKRPLVATLFADKLASELDKIDVKTLYTKINEQAVLFAKAPLIGKTEDDASLHTKLANQYTLKKQIWDALKENTTFQAKLKKNIEKTYVEIAKLHDLTTTTDAVANKLSESFQAIATANAGDLSGEKHFSKQLIALGSNMPHYMFTLLKNFEGKIDPKNPTILINRSTVQMEALKAKNETPDLNKIAPSSDGKIDLFKLFTHLLDARAINTESIRSGKTEDEAKVALFNRWVKYSKGIIKHYENAIEYLRNKEVPQQRAIALYDSKAKQAELTTLKKHLKDLHALAQQGSGDTAAYKKALNLKEPNVIPKIDDSPLKDRFNLQDKDYYLILAQALGLKEVGTTGSAVLTRELLTFLKHDNVATYLLTEGKYSLGQLVFKEDDLIIIGNYLQKIQDLLKNLTTDQKESPMSLEKIDQPVNLAEFQKENLEELKQLLLKAKGEMSRIFTESQKPMTMVQLNNWNGLVASVQEKGANLVAKTFISEISISLTLTQQDNEKIITAFENLKDPAKNQEAQQYLQNFVIPLKPLPIQTNTDSDPSSSEKKGKEKIHFPVEDL